MADDFTVIYSGYEEISMSLLEIQSTELYGRIAVANQKIDRGNVVLSEVPILAAFSSESITDDEDVRIRKFRAANPHLDIDQDFRFLKAFCTSTAQARADVLDCYVPPKDAVAASVVLREIVKTVQLVRTFTWAFDIDDDTLTKVVLIKATNAHEFNQEDKVGVVLYKLGSKIRHSCEPNVIYTSLRDECKGSFVATKDISLGEEVLIQYISGPYTVPMRQEALRTMYLFNCDCVACTSGLDRLRGMRCDSCDRGTSFHDQSAKTWKCEVCGFDGLPKGVALEKAEIAKLGKFKMSNDTKILEVEISRSQKNLGINHAVPRMLQIRLCEILINTDLQKLERTALSLKRWFPGAVPRPIIIGSLLGRAGRFEAATEMLEIARSDYELIFPPDSDQRRLLEKAIAAVSAKNANLVPDLVC